MPKFYVQPPKDGKLNVIEVVSKSKPGVTYEMRIKVNGEISCGCPWNSIKSGLCSHIKSYMDLEKEVKVVKPTVYAVPKGEFAAEFPF